MGNQTQNPLNTFSMNSASGGTRGSQAHRHLRLAACLRHAWIILSPSPTPVYVALRLHPAHGGCANAPHTSQGCTHHTATHTHLVLRALWPWPTTCSEGSPRSSLSRGTSSTSEGMTKEKVLRLK